MAVLDALEEKRAAWLSYQKKAMTAPKWKFLARKGVNKTYDEKYVIPAGKHGGGLVMFWAL